MQIYIIPYFVLFLNLSEMQNLVGMKRYIHKCALTKPLSDKLRNSIELKLYFYESTLYTKHS